MYMEVTGKEMKKISQNNERGKTYIGMLAILPFHFG